MSDLAPSSADEVFRVPVRIAAALRVSGLRCEGVNLFLADGEAAMQEAPHVHLHVIPRYASDGFGLKSPDCHFRKPARAELENDAAAIRRALNFQRWLFKRSTMPLSPCGDLDVCAHGVQPWPSGLTNLTGTSA